MNNSTPIARKLYSLIPYVDIFIAALGLGGIWLYLGHAALGGPISTDVLVYMNTGLNGIENTFILNRYFHIFLQTLFLKIAPTPLIGYHYFWSFLICATAFFIYLSARNFRQRSNFAHGIVAVGLFMTNLYLAVTSGTALVDLTAMLMGVLLVIVYVASLRYDNQNRWLIILFGALFFLAFKTKETTIIFGFLIIGLGYKGKQFQFKSLARNLIWLLLGVFAGVVIFSVLSWIFLRDPLFGLRPREIAEFLKSYVASTTNQAQQEATMNNWYNGYLLEAAYIPTVLYIISGVRKGSELHGALRLIWFLPLLLIIFVSLSTSVTWGPRFLLPAFSIICILAPQFLDLEIPPTKKKRLVAGLLFSAGFLLLVAIRLLMRVFIPRTGWDMVFFIPMVFEPIIFSMILGVVFLFNRVSLIRSMLIYLLIIGIITSPIISNIKTVLRDRPNQREAQMLFYPFETFTTKIYLSKDMRMVVSLDTWKVLILGDRVETVDDVVAVYNIWFNANTGTENFIVVEDLPSVIGSISTSGYQYILMSDDDWDVIKKDTLVKSSLEQRYQINIDPQGLEVLLVSP